MPLTTTKNSRGRQYFCFRQKSYQVSHY